MATWTIDVQRDTHNGLKGYTTITIDFVFEKELRMNNLLASVCKLVMYRFTHGTLGSWALFFVHKGKH